MAAAWIFLLALTTLRAQPAAGSQQPNAAPAGNVERGGQFYATVGCADCHGASGKGSGKIPQIAPPPRAFAEFVSYVRQPSGVMRPFTPGTVSEAQLADIYAFLGSPSAASAAPISIAANLTGNAENGKTLFVRDGCYECHGYLGQGGYGYGPRLAPDPIPMAAVLRYLRKPTGAMPGYTPKMASDQDIADLYAYLTTVPRPVDIKNIPTFVK